MEKNKKPVESNNHSKKSFFELDRNMLIQHFTQNGLKPFVANQLWQWVYNRFITNANDIHNLSKSAKELVKNTIQINPFKSVETIEDPEQLASKLIFECYDGNKIEAVVLKEARFNTLCISSQCGCPADCKFCLTGVMGFKRQLSVSEIIGQFHIANAMGHPISRIVFMGMGEPLLNIDNVLKSISILTNTDQFNISKRKITVSTVGYVAGLKKLMESNNVLNLAFSVGSPLPDKRQIIMPFESRNSILTISTLLKEYLNNHNRKLTLEYTLLHGINDTSLECKGLIQLAKYLSAKVNLINFNPHKKLPYHPVTQSKMDAFRKQIKAANVPVTIRFKRGQKIAAACGQLGESFIYKDNNR